VSLTLGWNFLNLSLASNSGYFTTLRWYEIQFRAQFYGPRRRGNVSGMCGRIGERDTPYHSSDNKWARCDILFANISCRNKQTLLLYKHRQPIPVAARSKMCVWGRSLAGIAGSNPAGRMSVCLSVSCEDCVVQVEVSMSGWSLVQRSPTECGVYALNYEASIKRRPWPNWGCWATDKKKKL
jgi:hypothetical protein